MTPKQLQQFNDDYNAGKVPQYDSQNKEKAEAFVKYINELMKEEVIKLEEKTTYKLTRIKK